MNEVVQLGDRYEQSAQRALKRCSVEPGIRADVPTRAVS
jgi:hypothetical protein